MLFEVYPLYLVRKRLLFIGGQGHVFNGIFAEFVVNTGITVFKIFTFFQLGHIDSPEKRQKRGIGCNDIPHIVGDDAEIGHIAVRG